jgi:hypothetical protein
MQMKYNLSTRELATVLTALRWFQGGDSGNHAPDAYGDLDDEMYNTLTHGGRIKPLTCREIDKLYARLDRVAMAEHAKRARAKRRPLMLYGAPWNEPSRKRAKRAKR